MTENLPAPVTPDDFSAELTALGDALSKIARRFIDLFKPIFVNIGHTLKETWNALLAQHQQCERSRVHARRRLRNTRVQMVQAKRKALDLSQDGKCCGLRTRKASYTFRLTEQRYWQTHLIPGKGWLHANMMPLPADFERVPARRRRKLAKRVLKRGWQWVQPVHVNCACCMDLPLEFSTGVDNQPSEVHYGG